MPGPRYGVEAVTKSISLLLYGLNRKIKLIKMTSKMRGWYNRLPIGLSVGKPARRNGKLSRRLGEKCSPGCWASAGSKLHDNGPVDPRYNSLPPALPDRDISIVPTARVPY